ncbi:cyclic nucleotide-binding domain-containing protein [Dactylosporangium sp. AC04546]|uniref:Crp/Fnr family transcriptional regulator n=1 Tax=Dactylosporangium sp. AC04546 TaxID=2862460 RepID=UPI001EDF389A|nr:cyclic nucleotide-binding domain-containing protein [Dactylosporangium sp. AC04546]WVK79701.1 cyclic nucleotide-binding domain-containing protein [Dactylosporangium sp. AC04546]
MDDSLFTYPGAPPAAEGGTALLRDAGEQAWALVREHAPARRYRPGESVLAAGADERCLWIVADGLVEVADGRHRAGIGAGGVFGELGFLDGAPSAVSVRARTDATVLRLTLDGFEVLAGKDPALARRLLFDLARVLAVRLRDLRRLA